jgi:signal transduction histidine kinase
MEGAEGRWIFGPFSMVPTEKAMRSLDLQARVIAILLAVVVPIFLLLTPVQNQVLSPLLEDEIQSSGMVFLQSLANTIDSKKLPLGLDPTRALEDRIQRALYSQPSALRVDVWLKDAKTDSLINIASTVEEDPGVTPDVPVYSETPKFLRTMDADFPAIVITYPFKTRNRSLNIVGVFSLRLVKSLQTTITRFNLFAAFVTCVLLIFFLSFFLRRAIQSERKLREAQISNEALVSRLELAERELHQKEKLSVMGQLTASFAHEIGTPLNSISGHAQLLEQDLDASIAAKGPSRQASDRLRIMREQLTRIESIVKGFLETTRKPDVVGGQRIFLPDVLNRMGHLLEPTFSKYRIVLERNWVQGIPFVDGVPIELEQILLNLLNNSIDAIKERQELESTHSGVISIDTETDLIRDLVRVKVRDNGRGIAPEAQSQIFRPFFTTKRRGEGHGLGLSICQDLMRGMGGSIVAQSSVGVGTSMILEFKISANQRGLE